MVTHHPKDGHPPFKIYQKEVYYRLEIWHLDLTHKIKKGEVRMVSHHLKDGYPPSKGWSTTIQRMVNHHLKIYKKEVYNRHGILHINKTYKIKTR